ncbi:MAG: hypothetical protein FK734_21205 [Asgard group archaeon]|nr:hypothetical protein [Asgard group archaeon]
MDYSREKRIGTAKIPIKTVFKFYRDTPRIDMTTTITNTAKDHRLRICFDLPYTSEKTLTSTHFGFIERRGNPFDYKEFVEQPSGIQAQKRFIRINAEKLDVGFSLFNKGLPEVELVDNSRLALTLIRAIGYLSRQDFPERPLHAGPFLETPGAQELFKKYTFEYSILIHKKDEKMSYIMDHSEAFSLKPLTVTLEHATLDDKLLENLITINQSDVRISSLRIKDNCLLATIYNITEKDIETEIDSLPKFSICNEVLLDGSIKKKYEINSKKIKLHFEPFEIKMLKLS